MDTILILDYGSQYTQLIARRIREQHVYSEIVPFGITAEKVRAYAPKGVILSGGPNSVFEDGAPGIDRGIWDLGVPILGVCYGMQLMSQELGGKVEPGNELFKGSRSAPSPRTARSPRYATRSGGSSASSSIRKSSIPSTASRYSRTSSSTSAARTPTGSSRRG